MRVTLTSSIEQKELMILKAQQSARSDLANSAARGPCCGSVISLRRCESWSTANKVTTSTIRARLACQPQAVLEHSSPMGDAMISVPRQDILQQNLVENWSEIHDRCSKNEALFMAS